MTYSFPRTSAASAKKGGVRVYWGFSTALTAVAALARRLPEQAARVLYASTTGVTSRDWE
jgi:hypothetical protein